MNEKKEEDNFFIFFWFLFSRFPIFLFFLFFFSFYFSYLTRSLFYFLLLFPSFSFFSILFFFPSFFLFFFFFLLSFLIFFFFSLFFFLPSKRFFCWTIRLPRSEITTPSSLFGKKKNPIYFVYFIFPKNSIFKARFCFALSSKKERSQLKWKNWWKWSGQSSFGSKIFPVGKFPKQVENIFFDILLK